MIQYVVPIYLSLTSRWHGGGFFSAPKLLKDAAYALPYGIFTFMVSQYSFMISLAWALVALFWAGLWKRTGHADFYQMGQGNTVTREQTLTPIVRFLTGKTDRGSLLYDAVGMGLKGLLIPLLTLNPWLILASGIGYPLAFYIGWYHLKNKYGKGPIEWGEYLAGCFAGIGFFFVTWS